MGFLVYGKNGYDKLDRLSFLNLKERIKDYLLSLTRDRITFFLVGPYSIALNHVEHFKHYINISYLFHMRAIPNTGLRALALFIGVTIVVR